MMTVMFSMLSLIPAFHGMGGSIQTFHLRNFVPSAGEAVETLPEGFTTQARHLTWVGVVFLAVTAFTMLVPSRKPSTRSGRFASHAHGVGRFLLYWAILSLGPLLLGAGSAVTTYITSLSLLYGPDALPGAETLLGLMPLAFSVAPSPALFGGPERPSRCAIP